MDPVRGDGAPLRPEEVLAVNRDGGVHVGVVVDEVRQAKVVCSSPLKNAVSLRSFAVFAGHRNLTTAAAELHISQPSLHVKVRKLAAAPGPDLYERDGRSLVLTPAGERLAAFAADARARSDMGLWSYPAGTSR